MPAAKASLAGLPSEIRLIIWQYAFGNQDVQLWTKPLEQTLSSTQHKFHYPGDSESRACQACQDNLPPQHPEYTPQDPPEWHYRHALQSLMLSKAMFSEAVGIFHDTLTVHLRSPEMIAYIRRSAPRMFREQVSRLVLYVHFGENNHFSWCVRLFELMKAFPALKCLNIEYHMRPPISYDNLQDVVYFYIPLLALPSPFNPPRFVVKDTEREEGTRAMDGGYPTTDGVPGMTLHTQYMKRELLFQAHFLGDITTDDAHDEHTFVIRDLFTDPTFLATTHLVLQDNQDMIDASVAAAFPPKQYSEALLKRGFWHPLHLPALQHALLSIARRHERPWFERLQRKRVVELYMQHGGLSKRDAENMLDKQLAAMPEGEGIQEWLERIMLRADNDGGDVIAAAMMSVAIEEGFPANWPPHGDDNENEDDGM